MPCNLFALASTFACASFTNCLSCERVCEQYHDEMNRQKIKNNLFMCTAYYIFAIVSWNFSNLGRESAYRCINYAHQSHIFVYWIMGWVGFYILITAVFLPWRMEYLKYFLPITFKLCWYGERKLCKFFKCLHEENIFIP